MTEQKENLRKSIEWRLETRIGEERAERLGELQEKSEDQGEERNGRKG